MGKLLLTVIAALSAAIAVQPAVAAETVYVVRHLQKAEGADPPLSTGGAANAQLLAQRLANSGIKAIFATPTRRAMETAEPLAKALGLHVTSYDPRDPAAMIEAAYAITSAASRLGTSKT